MRLVELFEYSVDRATLLAWGDAECWNLNMNYRIHALVRKMKGIGE